MGIRRRLNDSRFGKRVNESKLGRKFDQSYFAMAIEYYSSEFRESWKLSKMAGCSILLISPLVFIPITLGTYVQLRRQKKNSLDEFRERKLKLSPSYREKQVGDFWDACIDENSGVTGRR